MRTHGTPPPQFSSGYHWWLNHAPEAAGGLPSVPTAGAAKTNMAAAEKYFLAQGYAPQQVAGILANIQAESGFNPGAIGDNGKAYGIAQWHARRQAQFANLFGHSIQQSTLQEQLQFMQWELTHSEKKAGAELRKQTTKYGSGAVVSLDYERPKGGAQAADYRGMLARQYMLHPAALAHPAVHHHTTTHETHVHNMTVNTKATDAAGVARGFADALSAQANRGLR